MANENYIDEPMVFVACQWKDEYQPINNYLKRLIKEAGINVSGKMEKPDVLPVPLKETINVMDAHGFCVILIPEGTRMASKDVMHEISTATIFQIPSLIFVDDLETGQPKVDSELKGFIQDLNASGEWIEFNRKALLEGKEDERILEYLRKAKIFISKEYTRIQARLKAAIAAQWTSLSDMAPFHTGLIEIANAYDKRPEVLYEKAAQAAAQITGAEFGFVGMMEQTDYMMEVVIKGFHSISDSADEVEEIKHTLSKVKLGYDYEGNSFGLTGYVAQTGKPVCEGHIQRDVARLKQEGRNFIPPGDINIQSEICVPIEIKGHIIGVIDVESPYENQFQKVHQMILEWLSRVLAIAQSGDQLESFIGILSEPLETKAMADKILMSLRKFAQADSGFIAIQAGDLCRVEALQGIGMNDNIKRQFEAEKLIIKPTRGLAGKVFDTGEAIYSENVEKEGEYLEWFESVKSEIALPIKSKKGEIMGVVNLEFTSTQEFKHIDKRLFEKMANVLALVFN